MAEHAEAVGLEPAGRRVEQPQVLERAAAEDDRARPTRFVAGSGGRSRDGLVERGGDLGAWPAVGVIVVGEPDERDAVSERPSPPGPRT